MTLVQRLRAAGGSRDKHNIYDDAADRINQLETTLEAAANELWKLPNSSIALLRGIRTVLAQGEHVASCDHSYDELGICWKCGKPEPVHKANCPYDGKYWACTCSPANPDSKP